MILGHEKNRKYFKNVIKNGQLVHAYLFTGPKMLGKKLFAGEIFELINKRRFQNDPDYTEVGHHIEDVRNLKSFMSLKPYLGPYKIAVLDNVDQLTTEASNSLLKILEEPSPSSLLVLITSRPKLLLTTISSRCQEVKFNPLKDEELEELIPKIKSEDKLLIKKLAFGRPGWIINNAEKLEDIKKSIQEFDKVIKQGIFEKMQYANKIHDKEDTPELINNLIHWYYGQDSKPSKLLSNLIYLSKTLTYTQYNHRLALESFLINS